MEEFDRSLIRRVYEEDVGDYQIMAYLSRYGDLFVMVDRVQDNVLLGDTLDGVGIWQGSNVLDARSWIKSQTESAKQAH